MGGVPAGPSIPTGGDGRAYPRTKAGRTHVGSSLRAPVPDDDNEESEAEAEAESEAALARALMMMLMMLLDLRPGRGLGRTPRPEILCH